MSRYKKDSWRELLKRVLEVGNDEAIKTLEATHRVYENMEAAA